MSGLDVAVALIGGAALAGVLLVVGLSLVDYLRRPRRGPVRRDDTRGGV